MYFGQSQLHKFRALRSNSDLKNVKFKIKFREYYTIYVRHLVKQYNSIKRTLKIFVDGKAFYPAEDGKEDIKKTFSIHEQANFPSMINPDSGEEYPYDKFFNQKICEIDLTEYQDAKRIDISFGWRHNTDYWKGGYIIDGVLLMPSEVTPTEESMPTIEKFLSE